MAYLIIAQKKFTVSNYKFMETEYRFRTVVSEVSSIVCNPVDFCLF